MKSFFLEKKSDPSCTDVSILYIYTCKGVGTEKKISLVGSWFSSILWGDCLTVGSFRQLSPCSPRTSRLDPTLFGGGQGIFQSLVAHPKVLGEILRHFYLSAYWQISRLALQKLIEEDGQMLIQEIPGL